MNIEMLNKLANQKSAGDFTEMIADTLSMPGGAVAARREQILNEMGDDKDARPRAHSISEFAGPITSTITARLLGRLIGGAKGEAVGTSIAGAANIGALITAAVRRRRTAKEQIENDKKSILSNIFIPGVSTYDMLKRQGRAFAENKDRIKERTEKKKSVKKASYSYWEEVKKAIDVAGKKYKNLPVATKKILTTGAGALAGLGVGSISLGKDKKGRPKGNLLNSDPARSKILGTISGAMAGLHVPA